MVQPSDMNGKFPTADSLKMMTNTNKSRNKHCKNILMHLHISARKKNYSELASVFKKHNQYKPTF